MVERHRGGGRPMDRGRDRDGGRPGREGREGRDDRGRRGGEGFGGGYNSGPPPYRERREFRPPPPPRADPPPPAPDQFEEVDADLAVAILETAAHLTQVVGTAGLPEGYVERREAVLETFDAIYYRVLETVTGGDEEEDNEE